MMILMNKKIKIKFAELLDICIVETMSLQRLTDADRVVILKQVFNKFVTFRMPDEFEAGR